MLTSGDLLADAIAHSTGHRLVATAGIEPLPAQERILRDAVSRARGGGLFLPHRLYVTWKDVPRGAVICDGSTWHLAAGVVRVYLNGNLHPHRLQEVIFHELKHASDFALGLQVTRLELEERAVQYAAQMMSWNA